MRISDWSSDVCSSDLGGTRRAIVEIVDEAREAEARIRVELAGRGHEEIIALVLRAIERRNHRGRGHEQAALVVADTNAIAPAAIARRQQGLNAAIPLLDGGRAAELRSKAAAPVLADNARVDAAR